MEAAHTPLLNCLPRTRSTAAIHLLLRFRALPPSRPTSPVDAAGNRSSTPTLHFSCDLWRGQVALETEAVGCHAAPLRRVALCSPVSRPPSYWSLPFDRSIVGRPMGSNDPSTPSKASKASEQDQPPATTSGTTSLVYPEWPSFQAYSTMPPHGFFPPPIAANPQAHPYMWGAQPMVPPYGTPPPPPYVMYPPGTVYAHPSTPPGMHPFNHYPVPTNGNTEIPGAAPSAPEMNGKSEPGRTSGPAANGITSHSESGSESDSDGSDANSQNDSHSKEDDGKQDASQGMVNQVMSMLPIQPGAMVGVPGSTTNLNIGMDYWATPGSAVVPAMHSKAPAGSARGDQWDERELKKQKRKQSNRESARRSRLRKQAECEELGQRAESLRSENSSLRAELERIRKEYEQLLSQNASLKERLGGTSDSVPDINEQNDGDGSSKKQPDSDAQSGSEP